MILVTGQALKALYSDMDLQGLFPEGPRPANEVALLDIPPDHKYIAIVESVSTNPTVPELMYEAVWEKALNSAYKAATAKEKRGASAAECRAAWDKHWIGSWEVAINDLLRLLREGIEG